MTCTTPVSLEEIVKKLSYANNELIFKNSREKATEMLKEIASHFCLEKSDGDKIAVKAKHNGKTVLVELQVERSKINDWWLVTMTPHL
jgi:N-acetylmuramoyl-L-alanine amidase CwlA